MVSMMARPTIQISATSAELKNQRAMLESNAVR